MLEIEPHTSQFADPFRPGRCSGLAQNPKYLRELIDRVEPSKRLNPGIQLGHNTPQRKDIDTLVIWHRK